MVKNPRGRKIKTEGARWSSPRLFVYAAAGSAIGLNNLWQFPFLVSEYGGGSFVLTYLIALIVLGLPLFTAEVAIGSLGRASPIFAVKHLVDRHYADPNWFLLGSIATFSGLLILSYLSVIGGWSMAYAVRAGFGAFDGLTADGVSSLFTRFATDPEKQLFWHSLFMFITMVVVGRGVRGGFEPLLRFSMPTLFVILALLLVYSSGLELFEDGIKQIFIPNSDNFTLTSVLVAVGHAFFSLGLGYGAFMMYGAYAPEGMRLFRTGAGVIGLDLLAGLLAAISLTTILLAGNQDFSAGASLMFRAVPLALDVLPYTHTVTTLIYIAMGLAAIMTAVALIEPVIVWLTEAHGMSRFWASVWTGLGIWLLGIVMILSFDYWAFRFEYFGTEKHLGLFDALQIATSNFLLPLTGVLVCAFAGWALSNVITAGFLGIKQPRWYQAWQWCIRFIVPVILVVIIFSVPKLFL